MDVFTEKIEILPGALYFCTKRDERPVPPNSKAIYFSTDSTLQYTPFFADFGPLHLGHTYKFCEQLDTLLTQSAVERRPVIYYASAHPHHRANSAVLICAYLIFVKGFSTEMAYAPFMGISPMLTTFRDAAFAINTYPVTVLDCARAFYRVKCLNHFDYLTFDIHKFEHLSKLENGDVSWIVPGKFIAFSGPTTAPREVGPGLHALSPEGYVPLFKSLGVTCVVRFNKKCYDRNVFLRGGIHHVDLFYEDGGNPTDAILQAFLNTCENEKGAIAVHCKAGLGRTGTNIAAYMMKHYGYSARETTAWCRVCRPGSVVGPQQQYLETIQERMWAEGKRFRQERLGGRKIGGGKVDSSTSSRSRGSNSGHRGSAASNGRRQSHERLDVVDSAVTSRLLQFHQQVRQRLVSEDSSVISRDSSGDLMGSNPSRGSSSLASSEATSHQLLRPSTSSGLETRAGGSGGIAGNGHRASGRMSSDSGRRGSGGSSGGNGYLDTRPKTSSSRLLDHRSSNGSAAMTLPSTQHKTSMKTRGVDDAHSRLKAAAANSTSSWSSSHSSSSVVKKKKVGSISATHTSSGNSRIRAYGHR